MQPDPAGNQNGPLRGQPSNASTHGPSHSSQPSALSTQHSALGPQSSVLSPRLSPHVVPLQVLLAVWGALLALTIVTVAATWVDLGAFNLWLAMVIATVKASFVALYFMHLRYDKPFNALVFVSALVFVMLFVALALMDTAEYQPELIPGHAPLVEQ